MDVRVRFREQMCDDMSQCVPAGMIRSQPGLVCRQKSASEFAVCGANQGTKLVAFFGKKYAQAFVVQHPATFWSGCAVSGRRAGTGQDGRESFKVSLDTGSGGIHPERKLCGGHGFTGNGQQCCQFIKSVPISSAGLKHGVPAIAVPVHDCGWDFLPEEFVQRQCSGGNFPQSGTEDHGASGGGPQGLFCLRRMRLDAVHGQTVSAFGLPEFQHIPSAVIVMHLQFSSCDTVRHAFQCVSQ